MSERCGGVLGAFGDNDELLWFIILFLLLFWCNRGFYGPVGGVGC